MQQVARERRLRHVAEDQANLVEQNAELRRRQEEMIRNEELREAHVLAEEERRTQETRAAERVAVLENERKMLALETEKRQQRLSEAEREQRKRQWEEEILKGRRDNERQERAEESELQSASGCRITRQPE